MKNAIITESIAPMMLKTDMGSELSDEVLHGMEVEILEEVSSDWLKVKTHYHYTGFIKNKYVTYDTNCIKKYRESKKYTVNCCTLDVMNAPNVRAGIVKCLVRGSVVVKTEYLNDGWRGIILADGQEGYTRDKLLDDYRDSFDVSDEESLRRSLVETALSYLKTQYRWGGKTMLGIDCSGLTSMAYLLNGIIIYRDADIKDMSEGYAMRKLPCETHIQNIKPGDLLFFPGHVGMYIGNGKYVHSSPINEGVGINSLLEADTDYNEKLAKSITKIGTIF